MTKTDAKVRKQIQKSYRFTQGNWDIYIAFFELGFRLLNRRGVLTFITPDKWISKPFGDALAPCNGRQDRLHPERRPIGF